MEIPSDCTSVAQLLPWLLNGTLEDAEREHVLTHIRTCTTCRGELAGTREAWQLYDAHPPSETLVAYAFGEHIVNKEELQGHLESCATCRDDLELLYTNNKLETFLTPARKRGGPVAWRRSLLVAAAVVMLTAGATLVTWMTSRALRTDRPEIVALHDRVEQLTAIEKQLETERTELRERIDEGERMLERLKRRLSALEKPQLNIPVLELLPTQFRVRGAAEETVVDRSKPYVTLILATDIERDWEELRIEVSGEDGTSLWQATGLLHHPSNDFTIQLPIADLPSELVTLTIEGLDAGSWKRLETYRLRVTVNPWRQDDSEPPQAP